MLVDNIRNASRAVWQGLWPSGNRLPSCLSVEPTGRSPPTPCDPSTKYQAWRLSSTPPLHTSLNVFTMAFTFDDALAQAARQAPTSNSVLNT
jgi:hypothetical protein